MKILMILVLSSFVSACGLCDSIDQKEVIRHNVERDRLRAIQFDTCIKAGGFPETSSYDGNAVSCVPLPKKGETR